MPAIIIIGQFILGFFQIAASVAGLEVWLGLPWLIALPLVFLLSYFFPIIASLVGMFGAVVAWHWSWFAAAGLFFGPFLVIMLIAMSAATSERSYNTE